MELLESIQTIAITIAAGVATWYAYETRKLRKEAANQNTFLSEQIAIMKNALEPHFQCHSGSKSDDRAECEFINKGGTVTHVSIIPQGKFTATINPSNIISMGDHGTIKLRELPVPLPDKLVFEIQYLDGMAREGRKTFTYLTSRGSFSEEKPR
jgi:hypothetical protein